MPRQTAPLPDILPLGPGAPNQPEGHWPDRCFRQITRPELHRLAPPGAARARALVCAGGGYTQLVHDKEGLEVAQWLTTLGIEAHVLVHRLPGPDTAAEVALTDGQQALAHLASLPPLPLLLIGLSSGGHLAGVLACQPEGAGACGLLIGYAPLNGNHRDHKVPQGKPDFAPAEKQAFYDRWPIGLAAHPHGVPQMPAFLAYGLADPVVPVANALRYAETAAAMALPVDLHVFAEAPHGFALRDSAGRHAAWPALAETFIATCLPVPAP